jgi:hypothetical protein
MRADTEQETGNPWFDPHYRRYDRDREVGPPLGARVRHRRQPETGLPGERSVWERVRAVLVRDLSAALITGPVVVPVWWVIWKVCDTLWSIK